MTNDHSTNELLCVSLRQTTLLRKAVVSHRDSEREQKRRVMNDLSISNAAVREPRDDHYSACKPIPSAALYILIPLFILGFSVSIFVLVVVHNAFFFLSLLLLSILLSAFALWNNLDSSSTAAALSFLHSFPDSDLPLAREGQLVKITGVYTFSSTAFAVIS